MLGLDNAVLRALRNLFVLAPCLFFATDAFGQYGSSNGWNGGNYNTVSSSRTSGASWSVNNPPTPQAKPTNRNNFSSGSTSSQDKGGSNSGANWSINNPPKPVAKPTNTNSSSKTKTAEKQNSGSSGANWSVNNPPKPVARPVTAKDIKPPNSPDRIYGKTQIGVASYYDEWFNGKKMADGNIYDANKLTAAHRTLNLGSNVTVTNLNNGRRVDVKVTDRGPFADTQNRILDLTPAAARAIAGMSFRDIGLFNVRIDQWGPYFNPPMRAPNR